MVSKSLLRAGMIAAGAAFIASLMMAFTMALPDADLVIQPSYPAVPASEVVAVINSYPEQMLRFYAADSLFVLSYLLVFAALFAVTGSNIRPLAFIGLGAGVLAALCDATENAVFISYASQATQGVTFSAGELPLPALFIISNLKWMGAYAALYAFGLALPRQEAFDWALTALMLLFPIVGVLTIPFPGLVAVTGLFLLLGMVLFAVFFWRRSASLATTSDKVTKPKKRPA